jgi:hypothetical protein
MKKLSLRILKEYKIITMHAVMYNTVSLGHPATSALTSPTLIPYASFSNTLQLRPFCLRKRGRDVLTNFPEEPLTL